MELWEPQQLDNQCHYRAMLGPLTLWLRREDDELHVATQRQTEEERPDEVAALSPADPDDADTLSWSRYILAAGSDRVQLRPQMPDRSLVARPESVLELPPGRKATFYVSIPVFMSIEEALAKPMVLVDLPTVVLSNIWFGDMMAGELCYSLVTRARRSVADTHRRPHRALCTFEVRNESEEPLKVQRLRVDAPSLSLFDDGDRLWTNKVVARYKDAVRGSEIEVMPQAPGKDMKRVREARVPIRGSVFGKVFGILRQEEAAQ